MVDKGTAEGEAGSPGSDGTLVCPFRELNCFTLPKIESTIGSYFHVASTFDLPPLQGASLWADVPRVETLG
jgi:hypothetical protein